MSPTAISGKLIASVSATISQVLHAQAPVSFPSPSPFPGLPRFRRLVVRGGGATDALPSPPLVRQPPVPAGEPLVQMLVPMVLWNSPSVVAGVMSFQQFSLADTVPASTLSGVPYAATSTSFSGSYNTFLNLLAPDPFPARRQLDNALACGIKPALDPGSDATPDGWAKSPDSAGITRWRPAYGVSMTQTEWETHLANNMGTAVRFEIPINEEQALGVTDPAGRTRNLSLSGEADSAHVTAAALTRVALTPGAWFDATVLKLGKNGAWVPSFTPIEQPYAGLLSGRVSGLIVARDPTLRIVGPDPLQSASGTALSNAASVTMGGFTFQSPVSVSGAGAAPAAAPQPVYEACAKGDWIIGVTIEAFN